MTMVVSSVYCVLCFPHEGRIVTVDQVSFSHLEPSSGESMVPMIDNVQQDTVNLGVGLFPCLMDTFDFPPYLNDVKFILVVPNQPKATIFQIASF
jgi:hypothetical protein